MLANHQTSLFRVMHALQECACNVRAYARCLLHSTITAFHGLEMFSGVECTHQCHLIVDTDLVY